MGEGTEYPAGSADVKRQAGEYRKEVETARNMKIRGMENQFIAEMTGLTLEEVQKIRL